MIDISYIIFLLEFTSISLINKNKITLSKKSYEKLFIIDIEIKNIIINKIFCGLNF